MLQIKRERKIRPYKKRKRIKEKKIELYKKSLWILGAAVIALTGCTNNEVVDIPQSRAINFSNAFVNNTTRADVTNADFKQFWVYGDYQNESSWVDVFNNVKVSCASVGSGAVWTPDETAYWQVDKTYNFGFYTVRPVRQFRSPKTNK